MNLLRTSKTSKIIHKHAYEHVTYNVEAFHISNSHIWLECVCVCWSAGVIEKRNKYSSPFDGVSRAAFDKNQIYLTKQ